MLEILENVVNNVPSKWLVKELLIERDDFIGESACDEVVDGQIQRLM